MDSVLRAAAIYLFLLLIFRVTGKRSLAQITVFDFVLLLVIGEAAQQALLGEDFSVINAFIVVGTLVALELGFAHAKRWWPALDRTLESVPVIVVAEGRLLADRIRHEHIDEDDIMHAARVLHGLEHIEEIKYAVLERSGGISIVPKRLSADR